MQTDQRPDADQPGFPVKYLLGDFRLFSGIFVIYRNAC